MESHEYEGRAHHMVMRARMRSSRSWRADLQVPMAFLRPCSSLKTGAEQAGTEGNLLVQNGPMLLISIFSSFFLLSRISLAFANWLSVMGMQSNRFTCGSSTATLARQLPTAQTGFSLPPANVCRCKFRSAEHPLRGRNWSRPFSKLPSKFRFTSSAHPASGSTLARQFSERSRMRSLIKALSGAIFSMPFLLRLSTMMLVHSASGSMLPRPCPGSVTVKMTSGENLLVSVLSMGTLILPPRSYFSFLSWERSRNFQMLISLTFAPSSFEEMLLSFTSVLRCFDIVIQYTVDCQSQLGWRRGLPTAVIVVSLNLLFNQIVPILNGQLLYRLPSIPIVHNQNLIKRFINPQRKLYSHPFCLLSRGLQQNYPLSNLNEYKRIDCFYSPSHQQRWRSSYGPGGSGGGWGLIRS